MDQLCNYCIEIMHWWADHSFLTYGQINIILFVILQPLLIIYGCWATYKCATTRSEKTKKTLKYISLAIIALGIIGTLVVCTIPPVHLG